ncbi:ABC transporter permease [Gloeocapsopsis dulcis]|uniref:Glutathione ABC transporter permease GsiC n=1 Tax=Gloeocapsopsis dulcis AAB1 = 1H9 TaxID=1433147 RepID=A0A6N8G0K0_9CHRO|nr:ABC transporter permease [Gloeocapsopsis dulcis]MUL38422.1 glutathione ABC transporter permease GsiC [Gloeocapsopsis dulcis AAB1 = 1H9]WNN89758.1 ABC transporter permease [Gloeocapsopsis dulcis]
MTRYFIKRLVGGLFTIWITTIAVTLLIHLVPGDPVQIMYAQSQSTTPEQIEQIRRNLGLDRPIYEQYIMYMGRVLQGDLGTTIRGNQPVLDLLLVRLPNTLLLAVTSLIITMVVGVTAGFFAAYKRGTWIDTTLMTGAILGISIPSFWLGLMLISIFSVRLGWLPVSGTDLKNLILPALTLGLANAASVSRLTRSSMLDVLSQDYMRTARAKGLAETLVLSRHAFRNGMINVVNMLGLQFTYMMGGAIVVENVFGWNGIGRLAIQSIFQRDYPTIQGFILIFATVVVIVSIVLDLLYAWIDPRITYH